MHYCIYYYKLILQLHNQQTTLFRISGNFSSLLGARCGVPHETVTFTNFESCCMCRENCLIINPVLYLLLFINCIIRGEITFLHDFSYLSFHFLVGVLECYIFSCVLLFLCVLFLCINDKFIIGH
jgi:hypothetical protein